MVERGVLLVGSLPGDTAEQAMRGVLDRLPTPLIALPDGETGERNRWVVKTILGFRDHPDLEVAKDGDWGGYDKQLNFRVRKGHTFTGENLDLGYAKEYRASRPIFDKLATEYGREGLSFQVGIPGDLDLALFSMGPTRMLQTRAAFRDATIRDITAIHNESGGDVVFQLEVPAETVFVVKAGPAGRAVAAWMARGIRRLVAAAPVNTRFGVHFCLGDLEHKALESTKDATPLVTIANAVSKVWPAGRRLDYVHLPLAAGDQPPSLRADSYRPLSRLRLPVGTRFVAGFLHEGRTIEDQRTILGIIDKLVGHQVDVAASCGLGRRSVEAAHETMAQGAALTA